MPKPTDVRMGKALLATMAIAVAAWAVHLNLTHFAMAASTPSRINYQGQLSDTSGNAVDGAYSMRFQVYDAATDGSVVWDGGAATVTVSDGLFSTDLEVPHDVFQGQDLWLEITVEDNVLEPRRRILAAPYALSLRPGARIDGPPATATATVLSVALEGGNASASALAGQAPVTGTAVFGDARGGAGVYGYSEESYAVRGESVNSWGGHFTSKDGHGLRVDTQSAVHYNHGAFITANGGYGVYAQSKQNMAVRGEAGDVTGISQPLGAVGVVGIGQNRGVFGSSGNGSGVYGTSDGNYGIWGQSSTYRGVTGRTNRVDNNYGLYTPDNIFSLNVNMAGALMQVAQNGGKESIEPGDVVVFSGITQSAETEAAIPQVSKTTMADSTAVAGVVYRWFNIQSIDPAFDETVRSEDQPVPQITRDGAIASGEYLLLVVHGPAQVKASALDRSIKPGDLLSTSGSGGIATKSRTMTINNVATSAPGTVLGKALEALEKEQGFVYVYVTLQ